MAGARGGGRTGDAPTPAPPLTLQTPPPHCPPQSPARRTVATRARLGRGWTSTCTSAGRPWRQRRRARSRAPTPTAESRVSGGRRRAARAPRPLDRKGARTKWPGTVTVPVGVVARQLSAPSGVPRCRRLLRAEPGPCPRPLRSTPRPRRVAGSYKKGIEWPCRRRKEHGRRCKPPTPPPCDAEGGGDYGPTQLTQTLGDDADGGRQRGRRRARTRGRRW